MSAKRFMIYGANGYTARLMAAMAKERGMNPVLAGRNESKIKAVAEALGLEYRVFALDRVNDISDALADISVILHSAGPFSSTARPMAEACLQSNTHYLDITGEIDVFESLHAYNDAAIEKSIMIMPGVGFDVVPTDCLASHTAKRMPGASKLILAIAGVDQPSRGTAKTALEGIHNICRIRRDGNIISLPNGSLKRHFDFGRGLQLSLAVSWGDVATAYYSTAIGNVEVYFRSTKMLRTASAIGNYLGWLTRTGFVQRRLQALIDKQPEGPSAEQLARSRCTILCIAEDGMDHSVTSRLNTPGGYVLTCLTALNIVSKVLAGNFKPGFQTPSLAYGSDWITEIDGVTREDLE